MAFDGIVINSVVAELKDKILNGRIDKVYQPEKDEIFLHIRSKGENHSLLISASSNNPRLYLTKTSKKNPMEPPMFCMVLRKHLLGATILNIEQFKTDRIVFIDVISRDELGINREKRIVIEIMGRHSNIILIDKESKKVIDSINRVSQDMSSVRQIFPGINYELPPLQEKDNPLDLNRDSFLGKLDTFDSKNPIFKFFYLNYLGLSPIFSREICNKAQVDPKTKLANLTKKDSLNLYSSFSAVMNGIRGKNFRPNIAYDEKKNILGFHIIRLEQFKDGNIREFDSISSLLDSYFSEKDLLDRIGQKSQSIRKIVNNNLDRARKKLKKQESELLDARDREKYKVYADLISANIYRIEKGARSTSLENFYDENMELLEIPLDEKLPAHMNAQKYYKKYSRLKNASNLLEVEIPHTRAEIEYLENILYSIDNSEEVSDLDEIKEELISEKYIKDNRKNKKSKNKESNPHHYVSSSGLDIFVGKNNRQNDQLTFKKSSREDIWLHIQNMPGSHVILKTNGEAFTQEDLLEAASLAGFYSSGKNNNLVSIDYTERKHVRKQKGGKPGLVFYENFNTLVVEIDKNLINGLEKKQ